MNMMNLEKVKASSLKGWKRGPVYYEMDQNGLDFREANAKVFAEDYDTLPYTGHVYKTIKEFVKDFDNGDATFVFAKNMLVGHSLAEIYLLIEGGDLNGTVTNEGTFNRLVFKVVDLRKSDYQKYKETVEVSDNE